MIRFRSKPIPSTPATPESEIYPCTSRQMTEEEKEHYGPAVPVKGQPFRMPNKRVKP